MTYKKVGLEERQKFQETYITALREGFIGFVPENFIKTFDRHFDNYFNECFNDANMEMYICYEDEMPIGVIVFGKSHLPKAMLSDGFIDSIYFRKNYHGKGYAKEALDFMENRLKFLGYRTIYLWCSSENERAWRFYTKNNYQLTQQEWDDCLDGRIYHNFLFKKSIS